MIAHTTPNGNVAVIFMGTNGKPQLFSATPVNRTGVLQWLLENGAEKNFVTKVMKYLDAEQEAAQQRIQSGTKVRKPKSTQQPSKP